MNPELLRQLWLQVTPQRLVLAPAAVFGIALLLHQSGLGAGFVHGTAMFGFAVLTMFWGAREAGNAVLDEVRERTWEIQRMSALDPWPMTWGKLLGATAMPWYAGLLCLVFYVGYGRASVPAGETGQALTWALLAALLALALQGLAMTAALVSVHLDRRVRARINIALLMLLLALVLPELTRLTFPGAGTVGDIQGQVTWHGRQYASLAFNVCLMACLALWAMIGAYRMMCLELEVRTRPLMWFLFAGFLAFLLNGLGNWVTAPNVVRGAASSGAAVACVLSYVAGFAFARDPMQYRRVLRAIAEGRYRRALEEMPLWLSSAALALVLALVAALAGADPLIERQRLDNLGVAALTLVLLMIRDLSLLVFVSFRHRGGRADVTTLIYIVLLNRVAPGFLFAVGLGTAGSVIKPPVYEQPVFALCVALVHALIAAALAVAAYRRAMRAMPGARGNSE